MTVPDPTVPPGHAPTSDAADPAEHPVTTNALVDTDAVVDTDAAVDTDPVIEMGSAADTDTAADAATGADADPVSEADADLGVLITSPEERAARWAGSGASATALTWVDPAEVADRAPTATFDLDDSREPGAALWKGARLRPAVSRAGVLVPVGVLVGLVGAYAGATLLWPLNEVAPTVQAIDVTAATAPAAAITWPAAGSSGVGAMGLGTLSSTTEPVSIASITKVVSAMMILDRLPLALGEQGPSYSFTRADSQSFMTYLRGDQSALDVPVGGSLTEYQMLQGVLLGSANNYVDRLAREIWGSDAAFATAAQKWLSDRGIQGMTIVTPSGFDADNTATPEALIAVAAIAMQNPVFAEIVGTASVDIPGAGLVTNTNGMLSDAGVVGIKTGTLYESWNLLTAKDVTVDDTTVRLYAAVLTQDDNDMRLESTRSLFAQVEAELQSQGPAVTQGTVVATVDTLWGESVDVITDADAEVVLWNSAVASATTSFDLGESREDGDVVGEMTTTGPLNSVTTALTLAQDVEGPTAWWRLTHPLELFGLTADQR